MSHPLAMMAGMRFGTRPRPASGRPSASSPGRFSPADLHRGLARCWDQGWQPRDVVRVVRRHLGAEAEGHVARAVLEQAAEYRGPGAPVHPLWLAQLDELAAPRPTAPGAGAWRTADDVTALVLALPTLPVLLPPPSTWQHDPAARLAWATEAVADGRLDAAALDHKVLHRVRALLAKAESTTFPDEAEALTAKAQELVSRHAIDAALLEAATPAAPGTATRPQGQRVGIDDPYADAKAILLSQVAEANHCRVVQNRALGFATVFGFATDLRVVEVLFTSLLVQATAGMVTAGRGAPSGSATRTAGFRRAFLTSYAVRIGERLTAVRATAEASADQASSGALLPVLAHRDDAVEHELAKAYPTVRTRTQRVSDQGGWAAGARAADRARLDAGAALRG
jgi:hypothetical protein